MTINLEKIGDKFGIDRSSVSKIVKKLKIQEIHNFYQRHRKSVKKTVEQFEATGYRWIKEVENRL